MLSLFSGRLITQMVYFRAAIVNADRHDIADAWLSRRRGSRDSPGEIPPRLPSTTINPA